MSTKPERERRRELRLPAIEVKQSPGRVVYAFAVDGKLFASFASVSRLRRDGSGLAGYQRPELIPHVATIRNYLEGESPMIPNAVVVAFEPCVRFEPDPTSWSSYSRSGVLVVPVSADDDAKKPGSILDGQQRIAAIRDANVRSFPLCVTAFVTSDTREQTEHFIRINATRKMPVGLIDELVPNTNAGLPELFERRRVPQVLLDRLNRDPASPLERMIQTPTSPQGSIKSSYMLRVLENTLSNGVLYGFRDAAENEHDPRAIEAMVSVLHAFWGAVRQVFADAWRQFPAKSKLLDASSLVALGLLMDEIGERASKGDHLPNVEDFVSGLSLIVDDCRWTYGIWDFGSAGERPWDEVPPRDAPLLAKHLLGRYKSRAPKVTEHRAQDKRRALLALPAPPPRNIAPLAALPSSPPTPPPPPPTQLPLQLSFEGLDVLHPMAEDARQARVAYTAPVPPRTPEWSLRLLIDGDEHRAIRPDARTTMLTDSLRAAIAGLAETFVEQLLETVRPLSLGDVLHMKGESPAPVNGVAHAIVKVPRAATRVATTAVARPAAVGPNTLDDEDEERGPPTTRSPGLAKARAAKRGTRVGHPIRTPVKAEPEPVRAVSVSRSRRRSAPTAEVVPRNAGHAATNASQGDPRSLPERIIDALRKNPQGLRAEELKTLLRVEREPLKRAIADILDGNRVSKQGQKRATTYFARG